MNVSHRAIKALGIAVPTLLGIAVCAARRAYESQMQMLGSGQKRNTSSTIAPSNKDERMLGSGRPTGYLTDEEKRAPEVGVHISYTRWDKKPRHPWER